MEEWLAYRLFQKGLWTKTPEDRALEIAMVQEGPSDACLNLKVLFGKGCLCSVYLFLGPGMVNLTH